jgi:hypothetical protein
VNVSLDFDCTTKSRSSFVILNPFSTYQPLSAVFVQTAASSLSVYVSETNMVAKVTDSTINRTPCIAQAKPVEINRTFIFHPFLETTP